MSIIPALRRQKQEDLEFKTIPPIKTSQAPVAHTCNLSYLEGRDQEDRSWKPAPGK
jgi:hypothetical protein